MMECDVDSRIAGMIAELFEHDPDDDGRRMTESEVGFVETLSDCLTITLLEAEKLEEVWQRIFG